MRGEIRVQLLMVTEAPEMQTFSKKIEEYTGRPLAQVQ